MQLVSYLKVLQSGDDGIGSIRYLYFEIHIGAVSVKETIEHLVVARVVLKGGIGRVQTEKTAPAFYKFQQALPLFLAEVADIRKEQRRVIAAKTSGHYSVILRKIGLNLRILI